MLTLLESHRVTMSQDVRQGPHQPTESSVWGSQSPPPPHPRPYTAEILPGGWILTVSGSFSSCTIFLSGRAFTFGRTLFSLGDLHYRVKGAGEALHWLPELLHFHSDKATGKKKNPTFKPINSSCTKLGRLEAAGKWGTTAGVKEPFPTCSVWKQSPLCIFAF